MKDEVSTSASSLSGHVMSGSCTLKLDEQGGCKAMILCEMMKQASLWRRRKHNRASPSVCK